MDAKKLCSLLVVVIMVFSGAACTAIEPLPSMPTPELLPEPPIVDLASQVGKTVNITRYSNEYIYLTVEGKEYKVNPVYLWTYVPVKTEEGLTYFEPQTVEYEVPVNGVLEVDVNGDFELQQSFTLTEKDIAVEKFWPAFAEQLTSSEYPLTWQVSSTNNMSPYEKCDLMKSISSYGWPWMVISIPMCRSNEYHPSVFYDQFVPDFRVRSSDISSLQCDQNLGDKYVVRSIAVDEFLKNEEGLTFTKPMKVMLYNRQTGAEDAIILPSSVPMGYFNDQYLFWADPPIADYFIIKDACSGLAHQPIRQASEEDKYIIVKVPNVRYQSAVCVAYRVLGGSAMGSPNYDPECEYPTHREKVLVP